MSNEVDVIEDDVVRLSGGTTELLEALLKDQTTSKAREQHNIFWATNDYRKLGNGFRYNDEIQPQLVTGNYNHVIMPRVLKDIEKQTARSKDMAEVFTPSWICNAQNNLIDNAWFGREGVFNTENQDHTWTHTIDPITFPEGKTWRDYVCDTRMEITCGEAPYLVSRYDTTTGETIPIEHRIGLLDRKLRVVGENTSTPLDWTPAMFDALKNTYGFEWQGDNLLLAREAVFFTVLDYYRAKFNSLPGHGTMMQIAEIISWNLWQMDGLKMVVPGSCEKAKPLAPKITQGDLFDAAFETTLNVPETTICPGCAKGLVHKHKGIYCKIMDWETKKKIKYVDLLKL